MAEAMMTEPRDEILDRLRQILANRSAIVLCGRKDDAAAWSRLIHEADPERCLAIALDVAVRARRVRRDHRALGATDHVKWQHALIAGLDGSGQLTRAVDTFDPERKAALVIPDPLDPPTAGIRARIGRRPRVSWYLEDKTTVDTVWDTLGVPRAPSIVADLTMDPVELGAVVDKGDGVACSSRSACTPTAGGDGIRWWYTGQQPKLSSQRPSGGTRVRLMALLRGLPVRLHGFVLPGHVIAFPPMEIVALPRPEHGTFLCAGAVPTLAHDAELTQRTEDIGVALGERFDYVGAFSVDGVLTTEGFLPTDLNARLTSAIEDCPSDQRVLIQAANLLVRDGIALNPASIRQLVIQLFTKRTEYTMYGATGRARGRVALHTAVTWAGDRLVAACGNDPDPDGQLTLSPSVRGWQLTARLVIDRQPSHGPVGLHAPELFRFCDRIWATDFGELLPPFGLNDYCVTLRSGSESRQRRP